MQSPKKAIISIVYAFVVGTALSFATQLSFAEPTTHTDVAENVPDAKILFEVGAYDSARDAAYKKNDSTSLLVRAKLELLNENADAVARKLKEAETSAISKVEKRNAKRFKAKILFNQGNVAAAEKLLRDLLGSNSSDWETRYQLGALLRFRGNYSEAHLVLRAAGDAYNLGRIKTAEDLTWLGKSMQLAEQYQDANKAFSKALSVSPNYIPAKIAWANLFLEKYNITDAAKLYQEVLKEVPQNLDARLGIVKIALQTTNQTDQVRELLNTIEVEYPNNREVLAVSGMIAMSKLDCQAAKTAAYKLLKIRPKDLDALTILGGCSYFDDDDAAFKKYTSKVLAINPHYADYYVELGKQAEQRNRYPEGIEFNKKALQIYPDHPEATLNLAIGYTRTRQEDIAVPLLAEAFDLDGYNVRALNMKRLYTQVFPEQYENKQTKKFLFRAPKNDLNTLQALVTPLVKEAIATYDKKYNFKPKDNLAVEVYGKVDDFAVRTVGLPTILVHGICFGPAILTRSPRTGDFNWAQVVWHELAHVYHIQMSHGRVPRWFTEGLAEYETNVKNPTWNRHYDEALASSLYDGTMAGVEELSYRFSHSDSESGIVQAYQQASFTIHYIAQRWGFEVIPKMLRAWGEKKHLRQVFAEVLKITPADFDQGFRMWLRKKYRIFKYLTPSIAVVYTPVDEIQKAIKKDSEDPMPWVKKAFNAALTGRQAEAKQLIGVAINKVEKTTDKLKRAWVYGALALFSMRAGNLKDTITYGNRSLESGHDNLLLRTIMGLAAQKLGDKNAAKVYFQAATTMWPDYEDAWKGLYSIAKASKNKELQKYYLTQIHRLNQHDAFSNKKLFRLAKETGDKKLMMQVGRQLFEIAPFQVSVLRIAAEAAVANHDEKFLSWVKAVWKNLYSQDEEEVQRRVATYRSKWQGK